MIKNITSSKSRALRYTHCLSMYQIYKQKKMYHKPQNYLVNNERKIKQVCFQKIENESQVKIHFLNNTYFNIYYICLCFTNLFQSFVAVPKVPSEEKPLCLDWVQEEFIEVAYNHKSQ